MTNQRANKLVEAGLWLRLSGDVEGAKKLFEQALELDPENSKARELIDAPMTMVFPSFEDASKSVSPPATRRSVAPSTESQRPEFTELEAFDFGEQDSNMAATSPNLDQTDEPSIKPPSLESNDIDLNELGVKSAPETFRPEATSKKDLEIKTLLKRAQDLLELDDHTGAMELILNAQALAPDDPNVRRMREKSEHTLQTMFESKLGSLEARPKVVLKEDEIIWLNLDHRAGFVLAQIDGTVTFDDLFDVSGMSRLDTARILAQLVDVGVIKA